MKKLFTIIVCKVLKFVGGLLGKGSSLPGQIALKLCPDILGRIRSITGTAQSDGLM